ncbi:hypothetical protein PRK78_000108 [Emydomyces testavorans]|uniref:Uncharacterized protein n=1 Tax=Emydomyces testavorans TaxID=2070801 RepID=A0AAF0IFI5_9EURO|nr:hypothetical protein PRK78_000108 [Emydomyces testavorans]
MAERPIETLPPELIMSVLDLVPVLDYYHLKLAGSRYISAVVRNYTSRMSRGQYCQAISKDDAERNSFPKGFTRSAMEITIERNQEALVRHFLKKYQQRSPSHAPEGDASRNKVHRERRVFRAAYHWAAYHGSESIVQLLLDKVDMRLYHSKRTALHFAALNGHINVVDLLLKNGAATDLLDAYGKTPLELSLEKGHTTVALLLQSKGAAKNWKEAIEKHSGEWPKLLQGEWKKATKRPGFNMEPYVTHDCHLKLRTQYETAKRIPLSAPELEKKQKSLLRRAIIENIPDMANWVLDEGLDINTYLENGWNSLHLAVVSECDPMFKLLLERGADMTFETCLSQLTPFHLAALYNRRETVKILLDTGYFVDSRNSCGETALHSAAKIAAVTVMSFLIQKGADVNARDNRGCTPLFRLLEQHRSEKPDISHIVNLLHCSGADFNATDERGNTIFYFVLTRNDWLVDTFMQYGVDVNALDSQGYPPLRSALIHLTSKHVKLLIDHGADVNWRDRKGCTVVHLALDHGDTAQLEVLLDHGADVNAKNNSGLTPLCCAASLGLVEHATVLLRKGANINLACKQGFTPLHYALMTSSAPSIQMIQLLSDFYMKDGTGRTALLHVISERRFNCAELIKVLLDHGAEVDAADAEERTPVDTVEEWELKDSAALLRLREA